MIVVPVEVDEQADGIEIADDDMEAIRTHIRAANVDLLKQPFASREEVADHCIDHHPRLRSFFVFGEQCLLVRPCLAGRVRDRCLSDELPLDLSAVFGEGLLVVPILAVKKTFALNLAADLEDREREHRNENMGVFALFEDRFGEGNLRKSGQLLSRGVHSEVLDRFLYAEHVPAHNLTGLSLARRWFESSIPDESHHFHGKVVTLRVDDSLGEFVGEANGFELQEHFVLLVHRQGTAHDCCFHRIPPVVFGIYRAVWRNAASLNMRRVFQKPGFGIQNTRLMS